VAEAVVEALLPATRVEAVPVAVVAAWTASCSGRETYRCPSRSRSDQHLLVVDRRRTARLGTTHPSERTSLATVEGSEELVTQPVLVVAVVAGPSVREQMERRRRLLVVNPTEVLVQASVLAGQGRQVRQPLGKHQKRVAEPVVVRAATARPQDLQEVRPSGEEERGHRVDPLRAGT